MLEIKKLSHSFGNKTVLSNVTLNIPEQTVLGLVGINGAGKSTLLRLLAGVYRVESGEILYDGKAPSDAQTRKNVFFLPEDPYYTSQTTPVSLLDFYAAFYPEINRELFFSLILKYSIDVRGKLRNFSKGMRRQTFIALALAVKPKYLLLDEAFDGLDPLSRKIFKDAIISLVEEMGTTVIISSHSLRELEDFCDRFALLDSTKIKTQGDISEHVANYCKFELAFFDAVSESAFSHLPVYSLSVRGRFVTVILEGDGAALREQLKNLSPAIIEERPLDFEEMFIYDVEREEAERV